MINYNQMIGSNSITIFHQNICGLRGKTDKLLSSVFPNLPHILCFSELGQINTDGYRLGAAYCREAVIRDSVCIFVQNNLKHTNIDCG
jgi:hypothetical protein